MNGYHRVPYYDHVPPSVPPSFYPRGYYEPRVDPVGDRYQDPGPSGHGHEDADDYQDDEEEDVAERDRSWLPRRSNDAEPAPADDGRQARDSSSAAAPSVEPYKVSADTCARLTSLLATGISTEASKLLSKEFPLAFEDENFAQIVVRKTKGSSSR